MMVTQTNQTTILSGAQFGFVVLDDAERALVCELNDFARGQQDWPAYRNFYLGRLDAFYRSRGLSRDQIVKTPVWRIAQDIGVRLQVNLGDAKTIDYRDQLSDLIQAGYNSRREFCEATGLTEDMLSHVLAKRKDFGIQTLADALSKIGYTIHITELPDASPPAPQQ